MEHFQWKKNLIFQDHAFYFGYSHLEANRKFIVHDHDFAETFLVESGTGRHTVNGVPGRLQQGALFFIRPADRHSFQAGEEGLALYNCGFPSDYAEELEKRYFPDEPGYFRQQGKMPYSQILKGDAYVQAAAFFHALPGRPRSRFLLDHLLMDLFELVRRPFPRFFAPGAPEWLRNACSEIQLPENLAGGVKTFFRLAGRSPEHVARAMRRFTGKPPTGFVNELRMNCASRLLCTTDDTVLDIALKCGFEDISWFHRCFRAHFGVTPLQYRRRNLYITSR